MTASQYEACLRNELNPELEPESPDKDNELTLGCAEVANKSLNDPIFKKYNPYELLRI